MPYQTTPLYNLDQSVGRHAPNQFADVKLVENLLQLYGDYSTMEFHKKVAKAIGFPEFESAHKPPRPTGKYTSELQLWIDYFIKANCLTDNGRVDPMRDHNGRIETERGGKHTTLFHLCQMGIFTNFEQYLLLGGRMGLPINGGFKGAQLSRPF